MYCHLSLTLKKREINSGKRVDQTGLLRQEDIVYGQGMVDGNSRRYILFANTTTFANTSACADIFPVCVSLFHFKMRVAFLRSKARVFFLALCILIFRCIRI